MIRTALFCVLVLALSGSAIFRLHTEFSVRAEQSAIAKLDREGRQLQTEIDRLQFEIDVLESAPRLNELSAGRLPLAPGSARQMADGDVLRDVLDPAARLETTP